MYVCICNGYRDSEICAVAAAGVRCARKAYDALGGPPRCGRCLFAAQALIDGVHGSARMDSVGAVPEAAAAAAG